jgi:hypothetical protein
MAWYKDKTAVVYAGEPEPGTVWTTNFNPGDEVPMSGIYRCTVCQREITSNRGEPFPPPSHHSHSPSAVLWRLILLTNTSGL